LGLAQNHFFIKNTGQIRKNKKDAKNSLLQLINQKNAQKLRGFSQNAT
jgi:hypothetical protein